MFLFGCSNDNIAGEAYYTSKMDYHQQYTSSKYIKTEMNYISKISNVEQKKMLTDALNSQREVASGVYAKKHPKLKVRIDEDTGELKKTVTMNDGSTQEFVMLNYQDLKREYEMQEKYSKEHKPWPEVTELINNITADANFEMSIERLDPSSFNIDSGSRIQDTISTEETRQFRYNDEFTKQEFSPFGLMYYADELYEQGVFPLWPYLTFVKDQAGRGTCSYFAYAAGAEILLMNKQDISEQEMIFYDYALDRPFRYRYTGVSMSLEDAWPYNPFPCTPINDNVQFGYYNSGGQSILCSPTLHQGIPEDRSPFNDFSEYENWCDIYHSQKCEEYKPYKKTINSEKVGCIIIGENRDLGGVEQLAFVKSLVNYYKYPLAFYDTATGGDCGVIGPHGFEPICNPTGYLGNHFMLIVGYIPKEKIPQVIKDANPGNFRGNNDYIIVKNSYSKNWADGGFFYIASDSVINGKKIGISIMKYDKYSSRYTDCDSTRTEGVGEYQITDFVG